MNKFQKEKISLIKKIGRYYNWTYSEAKQLFRYEKKSTEELREHLKRLTN